ncbi:MAG: hypothetical protein AAB658_00110 [Chloroflexota bacterium]
MKIPDQFLERLKASGLLVSDPFPPTHVAFPDGYVIGKPKEIGGNRLDFYKAYWGDSMEIDAPSIYFWCASGKWFVQLSECVPGPGPGDFTNEHVTTEGAIADILDYFFGPSERMLRIKSASATNL